eukprot:m.437784 g.437784  ORF g.437784 m.437784 type:complete len:360 (+) comp18155_c0_seq1:75-1154(+)
MSDEENEDVDVGEEEEEEEEEEKEVIVDCPLSQAHIRSGISVLGPNSTGLELAYTRLDVAEKKLTDVAALATYKYLRYVDLHDNYLEDLSPLNALEELCVLDVSQNRLTSIQLKPLAYLQVLKFSQNKVESLDGLALPMLRTLQLAENGLESVDGLDAFDLPRLETLDLQGNKLAAISSIKLHSLKSLNLDGNAVETLEGLDKMPKLESLSIKGNKISTLEGVTAANTALTTLFLEQNLLDAVEEVKKLGVLRNVTTLTLSENNGLEDYRMDMLVALPALHELDGEAFEPEEKAEGDVLRQKQIAEEAAKAKEAAEAEAAAAAAAAAAEEELMKEIIDDIPPSDAADGNAEEAPEDASA